MERRNKKASVREIQQHTVITPLKSVEKKKKNRDLVQVYFHTLNHCTYKKQRTANMHGDTSGCYKIVFFKRTLKLFCYNELTDTGKPYVIVTGNHQSRQIFFLNLLGISIYLYKHNLVRIQRVKIPDVCVVFYVQAKVPLLESKACSRSRGPNGQPKSPL